MLFQQHAFQMQNFVVGAGGAGGDEGYDEDDGGEDAMQSQKISKIDCWDEDFCREKGAMLQSLDREIGDLVEGLKGEVEQSYKKKAASMLQRIKTVVRLVWAEAQIFPYGSFATGLCIPSSDLDIVVVVQYKDLIAGVRPEEQLAIELRKQPWIHKLRTIATATVPVIKLSSLQEQLFTDITFDVCRSDTGGGMVMGQFGRLTELEMSQIQMSNMAFGQSHPHPLHPSFAYPPVLFPFQSPHYPFPPSSPLAPLPYASAPSRGRPSIPTNLPVSFQHPSPSFPDPDAQAHDLNLSQPPFDQPQSSPSSSSAADPSVETSSSSSSSSVSLMAGEMNEEKIGRDRERRERERAPRGRGGKEAMPTNYYCTSDMFGFNTSQLSHLNLDYVPKPVRHTGTRTVDVVLRLKEEFPALETLVIILKQFLHEHDLKETFTGGLGSYCLVLMVASFLQIYLALCPSSPSNYGLLLLGFLELYGVKFDFGSTGISLKGTGFVSFSFFFFISPHLFFFSFLTRCLFVFVLFVSRL